MFRSIIAGCDGFDRGREAVAFAARLADATGARLLLVAAFTEPPLPFPEPVREQSAQVAEAIRRVRDELAPNAQTAVAALSPGHALRHTARREHADLIVVGSRRHGRFDRFVRADHALQVLHSAPESVAVVPGGTTVRAQLTQIVVGLDASREARAAVDLAADLARAAGARLRLQVVVDDRPMASYIEPLDWSARREEGKAAGRAPLERTIAEFPDVDVDGSVDTGQSRGCARGRRDEVRSRGPRLAAMGAGEAGRARQHGRGRRPARRRARARSPSDVPSTAGARPACRLRGGNPMTVEVPPGPPELREPRPRAVLSSVACVLSAGVSDLEAVRQAATLAAGGRLTLIDAPRGAENLARVTAAWRIAAGHGLEPEIRVIHAPATAPTLFMLCAGHDLLVVAAHAVLDDLPLAAVRQAPIAVLVARPLPADAAVTERLLVATDGSAEARRALTIGHELAERHGSAFAAGVPTAGATASCCSTSAAGHGQTRLTPSSCRLVRM